MEFQCLSLKLIHKSQKQIDITDNLLAWMNRCHWWTREVWMSFHGNCFMDMVLTNIFIHLFNTEWFSFLK